MLPRTPHPVITVPGWTGSGPGHWQTLWELRDPLIRRVEQADWNNPVAAAWVARLDEAVRAAPAPPVLVAHSLGCLTVVHWAAATRSARAAGALLVAPPDVERAGAPRPLRSFAPVPMAPLPFPAVVVASRDDPFATVERASGWADAWGAELVDVGQAGHLDTASGVRDWPKGRSLLASLLGRIR
jgi:predicted alpha/beta hydrolase family esterase